jgi:hypothetical protein
MQATPPLKRVDRWNSVVFSGLAVLLLVPVPIFAYNFTNLNWAYSINGGPQHTFTNNGSGTTTAVSPWDAGTGSVVINGSATADQWLFNFKTSTNFPPNGTVTFTSIVNSGIGSGTLNATWNNLTTIVPGGGGTVAVSLTVNPPGAPVGLMFSSPAGNPYSTTNPAPYSPTITPQPFDGSTQVITLTFTFNNARYNLGGTAPPSSTYGLVFTGN